MRRGRWSVPATRMIEESLSTWVSKFRANLLPVAVDYTWVSRCVKIQMSHVALDCCCLSLAKVKQVAVLSDELEDNSSPGSHAWAIWREMASALGLHTLNRFYWSRRGQTSELNDFSAQWRLTCLMFSHLSLLHLLLPTGTEAQRIISGPIGGKYYFILTQSRWRLPTHRLCYLEESLFIFRCFVLAGQWF